jgi:hypothetical protein
MPVYDDIRQTLQKALRDTAGLPPLFIENTPQDLDPEKAHIEEELFVTSRRPAVRGPNPQMRYQGLYRVTVCIPKRSGTGDALRYADIVSGAFDGSTNVDGDTLSVSIEYSELAQSFYRESHYCLPVDISWYLYSA